VCNNQLLKLQPAVINKMLYAMFQFYNITGECNFNHQLLNTTFCSLPVSWNKANGMIYTYIVFCPLTHNKGFFCYSCNWWLGSGNIWGQLSLHCKDCKISDHVYCKPLPLLRARVSSSLRDRPTDWRVDGRKGKQTDRTTGGQTRPRQTDTTSRRVLGRN